MTPEERAERLRQRFLFPEAKDSFVAIVAEEIRAAVAEEREACARFAPGKHHDFARGVLAALAVVAVYDEETVYREIVKSVGVENLNAALECAEDHEWSGLRQYGYRLPRRLRPAERSGARP